MVGVINNVTKNNNKLRELLNEVSKLETIHFLTMGNFNYINKLSAQISRLIQELIAYINRNNL